MKFISAFLIAILISCCCFDLSAQKLKKVRARNVIVAYDSMGKVIDSLTKDLSNQSKKGKYLDEVQVKLRQIELSMKETTDPQKLAKLNEEKNILSKDKMEMISELQKDKFELVAYYYIVVESFKSKKLAMEALHKWQQQGLKNAFIFHNKVRKWYYIVASVQRSYRKANLAQWNLQQKGINSWIYYWTE